MRNAFLLLVASFAFTHASLGQGVQYVGIPTERMNYFAATQHPYTQWCWAASIQMVLNYHGIDITQPQIVRRTYGMDPNGNLPDWGGNFANITANLNNWNVDNSGNPYVVMARAGHGAPVPADLLRSLQHQQPVIIAYKTGPRSGHAVVVTGASFTQTPQGPVVHSIIVRDPWPSDENRRNRGRVEYPALNLAEYIQHYWFVEVRR